MKRKAVIFVSAALIAAGCAHQQREKSPVSATQPATQPISLLALDEITPQPTPLASPSTASDSPPPLDAIELFAEARDAANQNQPFRAIQSLEKAIELDPDSFELRMALARAYSAANNQSDRVVTSLLAAVKINPESLEAMTELGKAQFSSGKIPAAMQTLRLARKTAEYTAGDDRAGLADYYLARSLQQQGYDRAAIDVFKQFLDRVKYARPSMRVFPELAYFERRPEGIYAQLGRLYERMGDRAQALNYYQLVAERAPNDFAAQAQVVKTLIDLYRNDEAMQSARLLVSQFHASADSISLLRLIARQTGNTAAVEKELRQLLAREPKNRPAIFALSEILQESGSASESQAVLIKALDADPGAIDIFRRVFATTIAKGDSAAGAKFLLERMAASQQVFTPASELWERLLNDPALAPLTVSVVQSLDVSPEAEGAKQFWLSQMAQINGRNALAATAMEKALHVTPPFAPAFRTRINQLFMQNNLSPAQKIDEAAKLAALARSNGSESIAMQVEAQALLAQNQLPAAIEKLAGAIKNDPTSPDLAINYANTLRASGSIDKAEQQLWKVISDFPTFQSGYQSLINLYVEQNNGQQAQKVLSMWLAADPEATQVKLYEAAIYRLAQQMPACEGILTELLRREPWNSDVLSNIRGFYQMQKKPDEAIAKLEDARSRNPKNRLILNQLIDLLSASQRSAEAARAVEQYIEAVGNDAQRLYYAAPAYRELGLREKSDEVLASVLQLDPRHAGANNDLGYNWAEENKNLEQAEAMLRIAIEQEPDNESYLDSIGWVLYKRGNYAEAKRYLLQTVIPGNPTDPQTLDHLGDVSYRLNDQSAAKGYWKDASTQLTRILEQNSTRKDLMNLQLSVQAKLRQLEQGAAVSVSPVVEKSSAADQASK